MYFLGKGAVPQPHFPTIILTNPQNGGYRLKAAGKRKPTETVPCLLVQLDLPDAARSRGWPAEKALAAVAVNTLEERERANRIKTWAGIIKGNV